MTVGYHSEGGRPRHIYRCDWESAHYGGNRCQQLAGACLDEYVTTQVLAAMAPASLEVSLAAFAQVERDRTALETIWAQRLERADYEVDRARRRYRLTEPENRLVARQLEAEWEEVLQAREQLREQHARFLATAPRTLTAAQRDAIRALADDLPGLWSAPSTTVTDRKDLLRLMIDKVTIALVGDTEQINVGIAWVGGHTGTGRIVRPVARLDQLSYYPALAARVRQLAATGMGINRSPNRSTPKGSIRPNAASSSARRASTTVSVVKDSCVTPAALGIRPTNTSASMSGGCRTVALIGPIIPEEQQPTHPRSSTADSHRRERQPALGFPRM